MKLQLNSAQIAQFAGKIARTGLHGSDFAGYPEDLETLFGLFRLSHDPFTCKDVEAVMQAIGYSKVWMKTVPEPYRALRTKIGKLTSTCLKTDGSGEKRKGYYTQSGDVLNPSPANTPEETHPGANLGSNMRPPNLDEVDVPAPKKTDLKDPEGDIEILIVPKQGVEWSPTLLDVTGSSSLYSEDIGLRRLAVIQTPCFGEGYDPSATPCKACPLAAWCSNSSMGSLADIARDLDRATERTIEHAEETERRKRREAVRLEQEKTRREEEAKRRAAAPTPSAPPAPATPAGTVPDLKAKIEAKFGAGKFSILEMPFEGVCSTCNDGIAEGEDAVHINGDGMHHPNCALTR